VRTLLTIALLLVAGPAWPCTRVGPVPEAQLLVRQAQAIVRVRAVATSVQAGQAGVMAGNRTQVRFDVLEVLKGTVASDVVEFNGTLTNADDPNDRPVPYDFIRPGGRRGNCFALAYKAAAEYLLLLRRSEHASFAQPEILTPYWSALAPTNEQLMLGENDPWIAWVRQAIGRSGRTRGGIEVAAGTWDTLRTSVAEIHYEEYLGCTLASEQTRTETLQRICVFAGSSDGARPAYRRAAVVEEGFVRAEHGSTLACETSP
jgi:hypothetical protein